MNKPQFLKQADLFDMHTATDIQSTIPENTNFTFIDLFAGIGGFHVAMASLGGNCVFASEKDKYARQTYMENFDLTDTLFNDDIRKISADNIQTHDVLCAGFPCQPFSQAGHKKGFKDGGDSERGNLFYCILDILEAKRPKAFILENVRGLVKHDEGKTFSTILELLDKANYQVSYKVIKASDFNVPQHRPRVFIVGFDRAQVDTSRAYAFPTPLKLTRSMSDIFGAACEKEVGFTLRVGGKGSKIEDRRNWEFYRVDGAVRRINLEEAHKMMTFPDNFHFPVSKNQAMKQLGNSVCVDVVKAVGRSVIEYLGEQTPLNNLGKQNDMAIIRNKGELSEVYALAKIIVERLVHYGNESGEATNDSVTVVRIQTPSSDLHLKMLNVSIVSSNGDTRDVVLDDIATPDELKKIASDIKVGKGTFALEKLDKTAEVLGITKTKGTSYEKADVLVDFTEDDLTYERQGMGIKSFLGGMPTLLNASQATNFIYEVKGLPFEFMDEINNIETHSKIRDRLAKIFSEGGQLSFVGCENDTYTSNLKKVDSQMPEIMSSLLVAFFTNNASKYLSNFPENIIQNLNSSELDCRLADFVKYSMLGIFPTQDWDGNISANGCFVIDDSGDMVVFHTNKDRLLKQFFYKNCVFDTPSSTRHRFGMLYLENNKLFFKLNLQLRLATPK